MTWKVSFTHLADKAAHYPFYKRTALVVADARFEAIDIIRNRFAPPMYGDYRASKAKTQAT